LTKYSLFRLKQDLELFPNVHFVNRAQLADVSCLLLRYKLISNAYDLASQNQNAFPGTSRGYSDFKEKIRLHPDYRMRRGTAAEFHGAVELVEKGLIFMSLNYREFAGTSQGRR